MMKYPYKFITVCLIGILVIATFKVAVDNGMRDSINGGWYIETMCGTITSLNYGRNGYVCYKKVLEKLQPIMDPLDYSKNPSLVNHIITTALTLKDPGQDGIYSMGDFDAGYIEYWRLAFMLFGYNIESIFYLYFLLFLISILIFSITFRKNRAAMIVLSVYLLAHYVAVKATLGIGPQLCNVNSCRFLPVLAILPLVHVLMLTLLDRPLKIGVFMGVLIQSILFAFLLWTRSSMVWMVAFLLMYLIAGARNIKTKQWPVAVILSVVLISKMTIPLLLDPIYKKEGALGHHMVWHNIYLGLSLHPQIRDNYSTPVEGTREMTLYSRVCSEDIHGSAVKARVKKWMCDHYGTFSWVSTGVYNFIYKPTDQDGYSAAFKWLHDHGSSEYYLFNFRPQEGVDYKTSFVWFNGNPPMEKKRDFIWDKDFNWSRYESVVKDVLKDAVRKYPLQVMKVVFIDKPFRYLYAYFRYYLSLKNLPLLFFVLLWVHFFVMGEQPSPSELRQGLKLLTAIFVFSLVPILLIYPENYCIADSAVAFTMCIFYYIFIISLDRYKKALRLCDDHGESDAV